MPSLALPYQGPDDIRIFHLSDQQLPPPVVRGEAANPSPPPLQTEPPQSEARCAFDAVRQEAEKYGQEMLPKFRDVKAGPKRDRLQREWNVANLRFGTTALKVARDFPTDPAALETLEYVLRATSDSEDEEMVKLREEALALILRDHKRSPELSKSNVINWMSHPPTVSGEKAVA
jgi:hypothetical protein